MGGRSKGEETTEHRSIWGNLDRDGLHYAAVYSLAAPRGARTNAHPAGAAVTLLRQALIDDGPVGGVNGDEDQAEDGKRGARDRRERDHVRDGNIFM